VGGCPFRVDSRAPDAPVTVSSSLSDENNAAGSDRPSSPLRANLSPKTPWRPYGAPPRLSGGIRPQNKPRSDMLISVTSTTESTSALPDDTWLKVSEVAAYFRVHKMTVYRWIRSGAVVSIKMGSAHRISQRSVERFMGKTGEEEGK
jgi:excisionase family DNA binding protein